MKFGLLGGRLGHSFSPRIHAQLADYEYKLYPMPEDEVKNWIRTCDLNGFNVTIPYKEKVYALCDGLTDRAKKIGCVNTVKKMPDGTIYGDNTDYYGFSYMVKKLGVAIKNRKILIIGSGGTAKTATAVLTDMGAKEIVIVSRKDNTPETLKKHSDTDVLVNASPVGMYPKNGESPVDLDLFPACKGIIDVIYNPSLTELLIQGQKRGIPCINGLSMLVAQAKMACEIFTDTNIAEPEIDRITKEIEKQTKNLILVGMPGCGKTTAGKNLALITGKEFIDSDEVIKKAENRSPSEIIKAEGEKTFREIETRVLKEICKESGKIIATGGGAVTIPENHDIMRQNGTVIFLKRPIERLDKSDRPLSIDLPALYKKRLPLYEKFSDSEVEGRESPTETAAAILAAWEEKV